MNETRKPWRILLSTLKTLGLLGLLIFLMMWLSGTFVEKVEPGGPVPWPAVAQPVHTRRVETRSFPLVIEQVGTIRSKAQAKISSHIMAQVREIFVREGSLVAGPGKKPADLLAKLDDRDIHARLRQALSQSKATERAIEAARASLRAARDGVKAARARLEQTRAELRRTLNLYRQRASTGQQLERARAQNEIAEARWRAAQQEMEAVRGEIARLQAQKEQNEAAVSESKVMLSYTAIRAPFSGKVIRKMVEVGDTVRPGQPLFLLETSSRPELHAVVSEFLLPHIRLGQPLEVRVDALRKTLHGSIREIMPQADPATRTVVVKVSLPSRPELVSGLFGRLLIPYGKYDALVIPIKSVRNVGQLQLVDVLDDQGLPQRRFITLGRRHQELVEVLSGLHAGEEVVVP